MDNFSKEQNTLKVGDFVRAKNSITDQIYCIYRIEPHDSFGLKNIGAIALGSGFTYVGHYASILYKVSTTKKRKSAALKNFEELLLNSEKSYEFTNLDYIEVKAALSNG